ncbi:hypothetical protein TorRG33x02_333270 [Trema orientale]|uniref:Uncharacterized protein n=1 Tax=Trema orientale TaxID=63057 RepID=A0A2P5B4F3_TREOI|nr:hypothetical protein TorRG33x02_333270 [Trema orientale]
MGDPLIFGKTLGCLIFQVIALLPLGLSQRSFMYAADFLIKYGLWNVSKLQQCFDSEAVSAICKLDISSRMRSDLWIWVFNSNSRFSTKSAYLIQAYARASSQMVLSPKECSKLWNSRIWNSRIHKRHKNTLVASSFECSTNLHQIELFVLYPLYSLSYVWD